jgi:hypothetical protein
MRAFRNSCHSSKFAHLNEHMYTFGSTGNIMKIFYYQKKGPHSNNIERFYIHQPTATDNQLHDKQTVFPDRVFDAI